MKSGANQPRVAVVVPRYGMDPADGLEVHCRQVAERLTHSCDVTVLTICSAQDSGGSVNIPAGESVINRVRVLRFEAVQELHQTGLRTLYDQIFSTQLSPEQEYELIRRQGPDCPALIEHLEAHHAGYDAVVLFGLVSCPVVHALPIVGKKALLAPSVHDEPSLYLHILDGLVSKAQYIFYNSEEERLLLQRRFVLPSDRGEVVGVGIDPLAEGEPDPRWARLAERLEGRQILSYLGRVETRRGCDQLAEYFLRYIREQQRDDLTLLLLGRRTMPLPPHPNILAPGCVSENVKYNALLRTTVAVSSSPYASRCMSALEFWMQSKPLLVNGRCRVLVGQCLRSNGGLWYENYAEFRECLSLLLSKPALRQKLGEQGHAYVQRRHCWSDVVSAYVRTIDAIIKRAAVQERS